MGVILRILLLGVLGWLAWRGWQSLRAAASNKAATNNPAAPPQTHGLMRACTLCGVHIDERQGTWCHQRFFCSDAHAVSWINQNEQKNA